MKKTLIILAVAAVAASLVLGYVMQKRHAAQVAQQMLEQSLAQPSPTPAPSQRVKASPPPATKAYADALHTYGDAGSGYRFQFADCLSTGVPSSLFIKRGVKYMLDNRDDLAHVYRVGNQAYTIGAYDFLVLSAPKVASTYTITCDGNPRATLTTD